MADSKKRRTSVLARSHSTATTDTWDSAPVWVLKTPDSTTWEKAVILNKTSPPPAPASESGADPTLSTEWNFGVRLIDTDEIVNIRTLPLDKNCLEFTFLKRRDLVMRGTEIDDMTSLLYMNEPELLECVRQRYLQKAIYTSIGPILLAMNPFERLPIYDDDTLLSYWTEGVSHRLSKSPHAFHVANRAYNNMFVDKFRPDERENQAILVNGESGAGKTESTKHVLHFLAVISSKVASQVDVSENTNTEIENQILASNPILESFGNAKTTRNNNSSRFGKFIELLYASDGYIEGAVMRTYLLETMRVAFQGKSERNYHIFYQIHAGLPPTVKADYGLTDLSNYHYTNQSGEYNRHDGESDLDNFGEMKDAFTTLGVDDDMQDEVDRLVVAILHIGNLAFTDSSKAGEDAADFSDTPAVTSTVNFICELLCVKKEVLLTAVARRSVTVVGNTIEKTLNSIGASYAKDSLAKFLYSSLFGWVVAKINACLTGKIVPEQSASFIGVLDIFGFEHFAKNSFEQLCINYTNEKLQDHFNYSVFKSEQEVYKQEGLKWTFIAYPDNSARLDLLEHNTNGIFSVLNEQLKLPKSTDEKLAAALYQKCGTHSHFRATRQEQGRHEFTILHYACPVTYQAQGFLDKNRTENPKELYELLVCSMSPLLQELIPAEQRAELAPTPRGTMRGTLGKGASIRGNLSRAPSQRFSKLSRTSTSDTTAPDQHKKNNHRNTTVGKKITSLSAQFQSQLTDLVLKIRSTRSHFICCVKPNKLMQPVNFDTKMCTDQLRCGGSLGAIQVFKAGFSNRLSFSAFTSRFAAFAFVAGNNTLTNDFKSAWDHARATGSTLHWRGAAGRLLEIVPLTHMVLALAHKESPNSEVDLSTDMQMGNTQVFMKAAAFEFLEKLQLRTRNLTARRLQLRWRAWRITKKNSLIKTTSGMYRAQEAMRYFTDFRRILAIRTVSATLILQRRARVFLAVKYRKWMIKQFTHIQRRIRKFLAKRRLEKLRNKSARILQQAFRAHLTHQKYIRFRKALIRLQSRFRGKSARKRVTLLRKLESRGLWSVIRLQSIHRGNCARSKYFAMKRAMIAKRFEDQLQEERKKAEMMALLQSKLEENPNLLGYLSSDMSSPPPPPTHASAELKTQPTAISNSQEVKQLRAEIASLKEKVRKLEEENLTLQNRLVSVAANPGGGINQFVQGSAEEWKLRAEQLEKDNFELRKSLLVKKKSENGLSTSRINLFASLETDSTTEIQPTPTTPRADPRDLIKRRLSMTQQEPTPGLTRSPSVAETDAEHPDWIKKYSDQHKRFYWRHKTTGKTSWTPPTSESSSSGVASVPTIAQTQNTEHEIGELSPEELRISIDRLASGWTVMKLSSSNYPKERTIVVDRATQVLSWKKGTAANAKIDGCLNLDTVKRVTRGRKSRTLEKVKGVDANLCLSVHYLNTSLDLQLSSENERNMMYFGLKDLTKLN